MFYFLAAARDPRATLNSIYSPSGMAVLLRMARANDIPLLFVTINVCNLLAKYEDAGEVVQKLSLQGTGLLEEISNAWYSMPHLKGGVVAGRAGSCHCLDNRESNSRLALYTACCRTLASVCRSYLPFVCKPSSYLRYLCCDLR